MQKPAALKKAMPWLGSYMSYVQLHQVPHLAHNHSNNQLLSSDACEEECPHHHPNGKNGRKIQ